MNKSNTAKHERMTLLKNSVINAKSTIELNRARIVTQFYKENENLPALLKRAGAMKNVFEKMPVYIRNNELIVGAEGPAPGSVQLYPEYVSILKSEIDKLENRLEYSRFYLSDENKNEFLNNILPYWEGKSNCDLALALIPENAKTAEKEKMINFSTGIRYGIGHTQPKYFDIVKRGTRAIVMDLQERRKKLDLALTEDVEKDIWYDSAITILNALPVWANNHAKEAKRLAVEEIDEKRRSELLEIARICEKVPAEPADTFHEALQAYWFAHLAVRYETSAISISMGRFDQDFYPIYKNDIDSGVLDIDMVEELMQCLWIKFNESNTLLSSPKEPYVSRQALTIGGVNSQGFDASNDLTYLAIKVHDSVHMHQPSLSLRCHTTMPNQLLFEALSVIRKGSGIPSFFNDDMHIYSLLNRGASLEDARNYGIVGCVEVAPVNKTWANCSAGKFNIPKCLMLALHNGVDIKTGKQLGIKTGDARKFKTYNEVVNAFRAQVAHFVKLQIMAENAIEMAHALRAPVPFTSVLHEGCIEKGADVTKGGAIYNWAAPQATGQANAGDSLIAIKKAVFEEKFISMSDLLNMMETNFENQEKIRQRLINLPKYGNDDEEADLIVRDVLKTFTDEVGKYRNFRGGLYHAGSFPGLSYISFGQDLGATPDGRKAGEPLAAGLSPVSGRITKGIASTVNSASKLDYFSASNGTVLTLWLNPSVLEGERGLRNISAVIKSYFEKGGQEIQFNVISADELRAAQKEPDKYRSLVVRVTGWSSLFIGLAKDVQDELIARTESYKLS